MTPQQEAERLLQIMRLEEQANQDGFRCGMFYGLITGIIVALIGVLLFI
jgi:hypothetical protein